MRHYHKKKAVGSRSTVQPQQKLIHSHEKKVHLFLGMEHDIEYDRSCCFDKPSDVVAVTRILLCR